MAKSKTKVRRKAGPSPDAVDRQPETTRSTPAPALGSAPSISEATAQVSAPGMPSPDRAQAMSTLQRSVGNQRAMRLADTPLHPAAPADANREPQQSQRTPASGTQVEEVSRLPDTPAASGPVPDVQRTLGDGHDLTSPRFSRLMDLEAAYDDEALIKSGSSGRGVQAVQQALYDMGYALPAHGADGEFGGETKAALEAFQTDQHLDDDGIVGPLTMAALDARFGTPTLPAAAALSADWTIPCVCSVLCPWSPHTVSVLGTRITLKSFDTISWADEKWDGAAWAADPFPGGGYNTGTEIGVLNSDCESMAETLYHEVLHAEQPTSHGTTLERESYAYRIGEEFSIAMGLGGAPGLRSTDAQGREFADPAKVEAFVASAYPSVPAGGGGSGEEIIGKAATHGHVRVQRADGSVYTRPAAVGEKVPGPITLANERTHDPGDWTCP